MLILNLSWLEFKGTVTGIKTTNVKYFAAIGELYRFYRISPQNFELLPSISVISETKMKCEAQWNVEKLCLRAWLIRFWNLCEKLTLVAHIHCIMFPSGTATTQKWQKISWSRTPTRLPITLAALVTEPKYIRSWNSAKHRWNFGVPVCPVSSKSMVVELGPFAHLTLNDPQRRLRGLVSLQHCVYCCKR